VLTVKGIVSLHRILIWRSLPASGAQAYPKSPRQLKPAFGGAPSVIVQAFDGHAKNEFGRPARTCRKIAVGARPRNR